MPTKIVATMSYTTQKEQKNIIIWSKREVRGVSRSTGSRVYYTVEELVFVAVVIAKEKMI